MKKRSLQLIVISGIIVLLCSCGKSEKADIFGTTENYTYETVPATAPYVYQTQQADVSYYTQVPATSYETVVDTSAQTQSAPNNTITQQSPAFELTEAPVTTEKVYKKTGEMAFSDNADNKYIKTIVNKYGVDSKNLVALYTVPDNDGNIVLEFDGSTDGNGKLIRNKDTLVSIYSIDKNLNSKRASEKLSLNEYSYGEMKVMFFSTTTYIMPEFEAQLNG